MKLDLILPAFEKAWAAANRSNTTLVTYRHVFERMDAMGYDMPPDLTIERAEEYLAERRAHVTKAGTAMAASSIAFETKAIKSLAKWACSRWPQENKLASLVIPAYDEPGPQPTATEEDIAKLLAVCDRSVGFESVRDRALILFFSVSGARRSEVAKMLTTHVDLSKGVAQLMATKAKKPREVNIAPIGEAMLDYVIARERHRDRDLPEFWLGQTGALGVQGIGFAISRRSKKAGIPHICTHSFRRGLCVAWLRAGGSQSLLQQYVGWTSGAMVSKYAKAHLSTLAVEEHGRLFGAVSKPTARTRRRRS